jgi:hypothetical protein
MPYLGDYLGQILSEISIARMHADLETVRIAELYAAHPLLRTMPVPHMRLPDVDLEIPVLIKTSEEPRAGESARGSVSLVELSKKFDEVFAAHLSKVGISLSKTVRNKLRKALDERLTLHGLPSETSVDVNRIADDLSSTALRVVGELAPTTWDRDIPETVPSPKLAVDLENVVRLAFLNLRPSPPRLFVLVTTAEIQEAGNSENITRLRLKVSEHGVEWTTIETEGGRRDRLIPE